MTKTFIVVIQDFSTGTDTLGFFNPPPDLQARGDIVLRSGTFFTGTDTLVYFFTGTDTLVYFDGA